MAIEVEAKTPSNIHSVVLRRSPRLRRASKDGPQPPFEGPASRGHLRVTELLRELNIEHAPVGLYLPGLDRVVVIDRIQPALLSQLRNGRLNVAGLIDGTGLQQRRLSVPA